MTNVSSYPSRCLMKLSIIQYLEAFAVEDPGTSGDDGGDLSDWQHWFNTLRSYSAWWVWPSVDYMRDCGSSGRRPENGGRGRKAHAVIGLWWLLGLRHRNTQLSFLDQGGKNSCLRTACSLQTACAWYLLPRTRYETAHHFSVTRVQRSQG